MDIAAFLASLEATALAGAIRNSLYLFPFIEAFHVIGLTIVFGTIAIVDFRMLGLASVHRPFSRIASDTLKWTWTAFVLTVATGLLMFITNATVYYHNAFFRAKIAMLVLAGINMLIFERTTFRKVDHWDKDAAAPRAGKTAAILSLVLWIAIIFAGRWIGFTTSDSEVNIDPEINLDELFPTPPPEESAPPK